MATYNKRGYKPAKPEPEVKEENVIEQEETFDGNSTTAEVFNSLDAGASKTEEWVQRNQKMIFIVIGVIALGIVGYMFYDKFIVSPKQEDAANEMFQAEQYFDQAVNGQTASDSLYNLSLKGGEGKKGFLGIIESYPGTDAANLAHYFAGMAYLNTGKYKEAVQYLEDFKTEDDILSALALGGTGDAFAQLKDNNSALEYYEKAIKASENNLTTPRFMFKAGQLLVGMNKKAEALKYFNEIKEKYETSPEGVSIDAYIAMAE
ncbi:tetratricopeptide repeat protein [Flavobacterium sp. MFBS3-15]|uniref:tetratricopeptide repeat protein n=1 Tax=Flavobacterium sp. MFBS3-15 TaxID=2989816 RepID=UPI002235D3B9|nr:tetratricopeptide repeat protein [Flavobacterium sp. MFBS3-15]MCW4470450.1 tetratricopeptide repeat protein [Flavobacterium sp. MFBS3-15]